MRVLIGIATKICFRLFPSNIYEAYLQSVADWKRAITTKPCKYFELSMNNR